VITPAAFHQRALYHQVFVPLGVEHQLAVTFPAPPRLLIGHHGRDRDAAGDQSADDPQARAEHLRQARRQRSDRRGQRGVGGTGFGIRGAPLIAAGALRDR